MIKLNAIIKNFDCTIHVFHMAKIVFFPILFSQTSITYMKNKKNKRKFGILFQSDCSGVKNKKNTIILVLSRHLNVANRSIRISMVWKQKAGFDWIKIK